MTARVPGKSVHTQSVFTVRSSDVCPVITSVFVVN